MFKEDSDEDYMPSSNALRLRKYRANKGKGQRRERQLTVTVRADRAGLVRELVELTERDGLAGRFDRLIADGEAKAAAKRSGEPKKQVNMMLRDDPAWRGRIKDLAKLLDDDKVRDDVKAFLRECRRGAASPVSSKVAAPTKIAEPEPVKGGLLGKVGSLLRR